MKANTNKTKSGRVRKGKPTISLIRLHVRRLTWEIFRDELQRFCNRGHGRKAMIARMIGIDPSQIHRYICPVCEHDQEPPFSTAIALILALQICKDKVCTPIAINDQITILERKAKRIRK